MPPSAVQRIADELDIMRLLARLAQAVDDHDAPAYCDCFAEQVICSPEGSSEGATVTLSSDAYARRAIDSVSHFDWVHHRLSNFVIIVNEDQATANVDLVVQMQWSDETGKPEYLTIGGRYYLELARLPVGWRITKRHRKTRYTIGDPGLLDRARSASGSRRSRAT